MAHGIAIIVPARWGSSRFPGKPLAKVLGRTVLERTLAVARAVRGADVVAVATDDERIAAEARRVGAEVVMTSGEYATGTDRVAAAARELPQAPSAVVNLQGDALLTPPWVLEPLIAALEAGEGLVTPAVRLDRARYEALLAAKREAPASGTTVTMDAQGRALYFSKAVIPFVRTAGELPPVFRHVGVYGYSREVLQHLAALPQSPLERAEGLEQLRALENGIPIRVVTVDYRGRTHASIDAPSDVGRAEDIIRREGELLEGGTR